MSKRSKKLSQVPKSPPKKHLIIGALVIGLLALLLNSGTKDHGYVLDDLSAITENSVVKKGTASLGTIWTTNYRYGYWNEAGSLYRPLTLSLFAWQWEHWPDEPKMAHITNVVLYAIGCMLLFYLLSLWFVNRDLWLPLFIAMLFASHPIHTEVVANIKSADELLAFFFGLITLIATWKAKESILNPWFILALICFFLAVSSKESAVTLLPVIPLSVYFFSGRSVRKSLISMGALLVPFGAYLVLRFKALGSISGDANTPMIDNVLIKAEGLNYFATVIKLSGLYLYKLILPHPLSHDYSFNQVPLSSFGDWAFWLSIVTWGALVWFGIKWIKGKRILGFALLFYLATFSLYSNLLIKIGTHFGERLLFLPSLGFTIGLGWLIWRWGKGKADVFKVQGAIPALAIMAVIVGLYGFKTLDRNKDWASEFDLYTADVVNAPNSSRTHYRLGMAYMKERAVLEKNEKAKNAWLRKAVGSLKKAVEIYPAYADAHGELGLAYQRLGYRDLAVERYERTLELNPSHKTTLNNMGTVLFEQAKFDEAISYFLRALDKDPRYKDAMGNLASCYGTLGQYSDAIKWFKAAIEIDPRNASYYYFIGVTYQRMGNTKEADSWLLQAYTLDPSLRPK